MTNINLQIGARIFTHKGNGGVVEGLENERVIIRVPDGVLKSIPLKAIASWEMPPSPEGLGENRHRLEQVLKATQLVRLTVELENSAGIIPAGTIGTLVESLVGLPWVRFDNSPKPCMVRECEMERLK
jgi:hypothetical protein